MSEERASIDGFDADRPSMGQAHIYIYIYNDGMVE